MEIIKGIYVIKLLHKGTVSTNHSNRNLFVPDIDESIVFLTGTHTAKRTTYHDIKVSVLVNFVFDQKTKRCFIKINTIDHKIVYAYINDIAQI